MVSNLPGTLLYDHLDDYTQGVLFARYRVCPLRRVPTWYQICPLLCCMTIWKITHRVSYLPDTLCDHHAEYPQGIQFARTMSYDHLAEYPQGILFARYFAVWPSR